MVGPSPRAWGSERPIRRRRLPDRSIPTCVGLGSVSAFSENVGAVHPHVRGARERVRVLVDRRGGPSPRAWGSGACPHSPRTSGRSIPTCVGLGSRSISRTWSTSVHPHVRGARPGGERGGADPRGPSPRAWGSGTRARSPRARCRSLPTCVGLGRLETGRGKAGTVHPHVRGARLDA